MRFSFDSDVWLVLATTLLLACGSDPQLNGSLGDAGGDSVTDDVGDISFDVTRQADAPDSSPGWVDADLTDDFVPTSNACDYGPIGQVSDEPRSSSFQDCTGGATSACDVDEACDFIHYDLLCDGPCDGAQTGDQRCHRICDDGICAEGERCEERPVYISDTPTMYVHMCVCDGDDCPVLGPGGETRPPEGGIAAWRAETEMTIDAYYHAAAVNDEFLFVSGGLTIAEISESGNGATLARIGDVFGSPIGHDGELGEWFGAGTLPEPLLHHGMALLGDRLYVAGGEAEGALVDSVVSAEIGVDGRLGEWRVEATLPAPRGWHTLLADGEQLIVAGGSMSQLNFSDGTDAIWFSSIDADGVLSAWNVASAPDELAYESRAAIADGRLFLVGESGNSYSVEVDDLSAPAWLVELERFEGLSATQLVGLCDSVLAIGEAGRTWISPLGASLGEWRLASRFYGTGVGFASAVAPNGRVYVTGGTSGRTPIERVNGVWSTSRL